MEGQVMFHRNTSILAPATDSFYASIFGHDHSQPDGMPVEMPVEMPDEMADLFNFQDLVDYAACVDSYDHSGAGWPQDLLDTCSDIKDAIFSSDTAETGLEEPQPEHLDPKSPSINPTDAVMTDGNPSQVETGRRTPTAPESSDPIPTVTGHVQSELVRSPDMDSHAHHDSPLPTVTATPTAGSTGANNSAPITGCVQSTATSPIGADVESNAASSTNQTNPTEEDTTVNERTTEEQCSPDSLGKTRSGGLSQDASSVAPHITTDGDDGRNLTSTHPTDQTKENGLQSRPIPTDGEEVSTPGKCSTGSPPGGAVYIDLTETQTRKRKRNPLSQAATGVNHQPEEQARAKRRMKSSRKDTDRPAKSHGPRLVHLSLDEVTFNVSGRRATYRWDSRTSVWKTGSGGMELLQDRLSPKLMSLLEKAKVRPACDAEPVYLRQEPGQYVLEGLDVNEEMITVTLGEFKDMFENPVGRPYVGFVM